LEKNTIIHPNGIKEKNKDSKTTLFTGAIRENIIFANNNTVKGN